jgi:hypothetical protein
MSVESNKRRAGERRGMVRELAACVALGAAATVDFVFRHSTQIPHCGCWLWDHGTNGQGYAVISDPRVPPERESQPRVLVHRLICEMIHGPMPEGFLSRHTCDMPLCVNLDHLLPGTHQDNSDDKWRRGRGIIMAGEQNGRATITRAEAAAIRSARGACSAKKLAARYGTSAKAVRRIWTGETWASA